MKPEQKEFRPAACGQILRCFLKKPIGLKNRQDSKEAGHGSTSGKWKEKINNKLSQPRTHRTITKRKDLPVQTYQKVFYPKA
jgi:hypothetical protein|nr:MAG TPA: hypothetical protein [Caudoviricetes sp.]